VEARGVLLATTRSEETPLEHPYVLHVPYTDLEEYCEWTQVPVTFTRWEDGRQVTVTEHRSECQTRTREVAKVRTEPRVLRFQGRRVQQSFRIQVEASLRLGDHAFRAAISDALNEMDLAKKALAKLKKAVAGIPLPKEKPYRDDPSRESNYTLHFTDKPMEKPADVQKLNTYELSHAIYYFHSMWDSKEPKRMARARKMLLAIFAEFDRRGMKGVRPVAAQKWVAAYSHTAMGLRSA